MQTNLRGRDFIGDLDFSKEEIETVLDVAWDLKRKRALGEPHALLRDKVLAMLFFFSSTRLRGKRVVVSWAYAASYLKPISVPQSLILQLPRFGADVVLSHPEGFELMPEVMDQAREQAKKYKTGFDVVHDMKAGFKDGDVIYAKSWGPLLTTKDTDKGKVLQDANQGWITNASKMAVAKDNAFYMHPLPADRDVEITSEVLDGPQSVVIDQAENRLHAQKAVMALTMSKRGDLRLM